MSEAPEGWEWYDAQSLLERFPGLGSLVEAECYIADIGERFPGVVRSREGHRELCVPDGLEHRAHWPNLPPGTRTRDGGSVELPRK